MAEAKFPDASWILSLYQTGQTPSSPLETDGTGDQEVVPLSHLHQTDRPFSNGFPSSKRVLNAIARLLLIGVYDDGHPLSIFRGMRYLIQSILEIARGNMEFIDVDEQSPGYNAVKLKDDYMGSFPVTMQFPKPMGININMMPFIMTLDFENTKLPEYLREYHSMFIKHILDGNQGEIDKIGFLTIQESFVEKGKTQRRPGLHVERPGVIDISKGDGALKVKQQFMNGWGGGHQFVDETSKYSGGIYMASNTEKSCKLWNCKIIADRRNNKENIGRNGDIEHLRSDLEDVESEIMWKNSLYWISDRTPHEALPAEESGDRQFLRVVCHEVGIWFEEHSTPNPNGLKPDPKITKIVKGSKFKKDDLVIVDEASGNQNDDD